MDTRTVHNLRLIEVAAGMAPINEYPPARVAELKRQRDELRALTYKDKAVTYRLGRIHTMLERAGEL